MKNTSNKKYEKIQPPDPLSRRIQNKYKINTKVLQKYKILIQNNTKIQNRYKMLPKIQQIEGAASSRTPKGCGGDLWVLYFVPKYDSNHI